MIVAWVKCDVCYRRVSVTPYTVGGVTLNLCPSCYLALSSYITQARRPKVEPDEEVLRRFTGRAKSRRGV